MLLEGEVDWTLTFAVLAAIGFGLALLGGYAAFRNGRRGHSAHSRLDDARQTAAASDKRLFEILNAIPVALVQTDLEGRFVFANRTAHQLLGRRDAALLGLRFHSATWGISFPDGRPIPPDMLPSARALRGQTVKGFQHLMANPSTRRRMLVSVTAMPIMNDEGRIIGSTAAVVETESLTRPETADLPADADTPPDTPAGQTSGPGPDVNSPARPYEEVGRISGGLAQDFGSLLTVMNNALEILSERPEDAGRVRRLAQAALDAGRRGEALTRRMAALTAGETLSSDHLLDAAILLRAFEDRLRQSAGASVDLMLILPDGPTPVRADPVAFESAVTALIRNAVEAGARSISARLAAEAGGAVLTITDDGAGMDADTLKRAPEPFFTTREAATGLGLTQAAAFARAHGGDLVLGSVEGRGSEAVLTLPAPPSAQGEDPEAGILAIDG